MRQITPVYGVHYRPGTVLFSRKDGAFLSNGITWFLNQAESCEFVASHVLLAVDKDRGIESAERGVEYCDLKDYFDDPGYQIVCRDAQGMDDFAFWQMMGRADELEGKETPYDYTGLLGFTLVILSNLSGMFKWLRKMPVPFHFPGARVCSAFVADCFKHTDRFQNVPMLKEYHVTRITPVMLWNSFPWKPFDFEEGK